MSWTKTREAMAAIVAIILVIVFAAIGAAIFGWDIPILSKITDALGLTGR